MMKTTINNTQPAPTLGEFFRMVRLHDWLWYMADDFGAYRRGNQREGELRSLAERMGSKYQRTYNTVAAAVRTQPSKLLTDVELTFPDAGLDGNLLHNMRRLLFGAEGITPEQAAEELRRLQEELDRHE